MSVSTTSRDSVRYYETDDDLAQSKFNKLSMSLLANHPLPVLPSPRWEGARQLRVNWNSFAMAGIINESQAEALDLLCIAKRADYPSIIREDVKKFEDIFVKVLSNVNTPEALHQILTLLSDAFLFDPTLTTAFSKHIDVFMKILTKGDDYVRAIGSIIVSKLLVGEPNKLNQEKLTQFVQWLCDDIVGKPAAASNLQLLLRRSDFREVVFRAGAVTAVAKGLRSLLQPIRNLQTVYELICSCWLISFDKEVCPHMNEDSDIIRTLIDILRVVEKEKIIRLAVATLKNLSAERRHTSFIITIEGDRVISNISRRTFVDPDLIEDIKVLTSNMEHDLSSFSSLDQYKSEISSGSLVWSPVHRNEKFWQENNVLFEDNNKQLLVQLISLLDSKDNTTVAVACFDIGEFVRFHPRGKKIIDELNGKSKIMRIMTESSDLEVRKQALVAVQKMMVKKWEFIK